MALGDTVSRLLHKIPTGPLGVLGDGDGVGYVADVLRSTFEKYSPISPTDVEIYASEPIPGGKRYHITVTGIVKKFAETRAEVEPIPGILNKATDNVKVMSVEKVGDRPLRKTWDIAVDVRSKK